MRLHIIPNACSSPSRQPYLWWTINKLLCAFISTYSVQLLISRVIARVSMEEESHHIACYATSCFVEVSSLYLIFHESLDSIDPMCWCLVFQIGTRHPCRKHLSLEPSHVCFAWCLGLGSRKIIAIRVAGWRYILLQHVSSL